MFALLAAMQPEPPRPEMGGGGYGMFLLESLLILVLVCAVAWVVLRFGLRRLLPGAGALAGRDGPLRVVARLPLEPRRTLYLIEAGGKVLLVGASDQGPLATLAELDPSVLRELEAAVPPRRSFADVLAGLARRRAGGDR